MTALIDTDNPYRTVLDLEGVLLETLILRTLLGDQKRSGADLDKVVSMGVEVYSRTTWEHTTLKLTRKETLSIRVYAALNRLLKNKSIHVGGGKFSVWYWKTCRFSITKEGKRHLIRTAEHANSIS